MRNLIFKDIIRHHDLRFAQRIYPSVVFSNKLISNDKVVAITAEFVNPLLQSCINVSVISQIFTEDIVKKYIEKIPKEMLSGVDDVEDTVVFWLSYYMGITCSDLRNGEDVSALLLHMYTSYDGRGFVYGYEPQEKHIQQLLGKTDFCTFRLLQNNRLAQEPNDVIGYIDFYTSMSDEKFLQEVSSDAFYNDFNPLPDDCLLLLKYLIQIKEYEVWSSIFRDIKIPFLQKEFFACVRELSDVTELLKAYNKVQDDRAKAYRRMFMNIWFNKLVRLQELCIKALPKDEYEEVVIRTFYESHTELEIELAKQCDDGIAVFVEVCGYPEISEWIFSKSLRGNETYDTNRAYNIILGKVQEKIANNAPIESYNYEARDVHYLAFVAQQLTDKGIADVSRDTLLSNIWNFIKSEDFLWPASLEKQYLTDMRAIAGLVAMKMSEDTFSSIIENFKVRYEGINAIHMKDWPKAAVRECYIYCILLLALEDDSISSENKEQIYHKITGALLRQVYCCGMDLIVESEYLYPLIVAEVIADQLLPNCKEPFEQSMCKRISDKAIIMKVLSFSKTDVSVSARKAIMQFRDNDWSIIRQGFLHRHLASKVQEIERLYVRLGI